MHKGLKIEKSPLPFDSNLKADASYQFIDGYRINFIDKKDEMGITTIAKLFFTSEPDWVKKLMKIRDKAVAKFGLKTSGTINDKVKELQEFKAEIGQKVGIFKVYHQSKNEVILGEDDQHLNFRVSLFLEYVAFEKKRLSISTLVKFHNVWGRAYFVPVKPIHKHIVPTILNKLVKQIQTLQNNS